MEDNKVLLLALYINARRLHSRAFRDLRESIRCKTALYIHDQLMEETMNPDQVPDDLIDLVIDPTYCNSIINKRSDYKERVDVCGGDAFDAMEQLILQVLPGALLKTFYAIELDTIECIVGLSLLPDIANHPAWEETQNHMAQVLARIIGNRCRNCGKDAKMVCNKCKVVRFCCKQCKEGHTKKECKIILINDIQ
jgi:hypothetical protein